MDAYQEVSPSEFCIHFPSPHIPATYPAQRSDDRNKKSISDVIPRHIVL
jgi:hypothetical protein